MRKIVRRRRESEFNAEVLSFENGVQMRKLFALMDNNIFFWHFIEFDRVKYSLSAPENSSLKRFTNDISKDTLTL